MRVSETPEYNFQVTKRFRSYVSKPEITDLSPDFLVKGSKNVLIDYAKRVISRNGYTLYRAENNGGGGIKSAFDWHTSTAKDFSLRAYDDKLEFDWNGSYNQLLSGLATPYMQFAKVWDDTEKLDVLLFVLGDTNIRMWSGGASKLRSATASTVKKQGVISSATTIAFVAGVAGVTAPTITDSANNFLNAGFAAGDTLYVTGSSANSRNFTIGSVTAGTITLIMSNTLTAEAAGTAITLTNGEPTWASARFLSSGTRRFLYSGLEYGYTGGESTDTLTGVSAVVGTTLGNPTITLASPAVVTLVAHGLVVGDVIRFSTTGTLPTGITAGTGYYVIAAGLTADTFEFSTSVGGSAVNTSVGQSGVHTLKKVSFPSITLADPVWQSVRVIANPAAINANFKQDLIGVQLNQVILASTKSQEIYISKNNDYTNFTVPSPRAPGDPAKVNMDNYCTCIIPQDNSAQTESNLLFGGGTSDFFKLDYKLSQDLSAELVRMIKLKTAIGSGVISVNAIANIKNATVYVSREPSLDSIGEVEKVDSKNNAPISDPIKTDFDSYDFTGSNVRYWKRAIFVSVPAHGLLLIYDLQQGLWQPPQTIPVGCFSIIGDWLYGHSSITNETYKLFTGTNDNGVFIPQVARFAYNNGGRRDRIKNMSNYWSDGYISPNGVLDMTQNFGYEGTVGIKNMTIRGSDSSIVTPVGASPLGDESLGVNPLGGATLGPIPGLPNTNGATLLRFWQIDSMKAVDYTEQFAEYTMNTLDGQFALVAHGSDQIDAGTAPSSHTK